MNTIRLQRESRDNLTHDEFLVSTRCPIVQYCLKKKASLGLRCDQVENESMVSLNNIDSPMMAGFFNDAASCTLFLPVDVDLCLDFLIAIRGEVSILLDNVSFSLSASARMEGVNMSYRRSTN